MSRNATSAASRLGVVSLPGAAAATYDGETELYQAGG
jgi:hypothetical protein